HYSRSCGGSERRAFAACGRAKRRRTLPAFRSFVARGVCVATFAWIQRCPLRRVEPCRGLALQVLASCTLRLALPAAPCKTLNAVPFGSGPWCQGPLVEL